MKIILKLRNILTNLKGIIKTVNNNLAANNNNKEIYWCLLEIQNELDKLKQDIIKDRIETKNFYKSLKLKLPKDGQNTAVHNKTVIS